MSTLRVISVFLASPGDLAAEREAARNVVEQVNAHVGRPQALRFELYGWEQEPPGAGRAQGRINPHVDEADLFIGLLGRRWGTPSGDEYSSGFEEEWERACERNRQEGKPDIWLFFKTVEEAQRLDAGPELQRVLSFRAKIEEQRTALYREFADLSDWKEQLLLLLAGYVAVRAKEHASTEPDRTPRLARGSSSEANEAASVDSLDQLRESLENVRSVVGRPDASPSLFDAARVLLASFRWVSRGRTAEVMDTHELNLLFQMRERLRINDDERLELIRSMLTAGSVRPGWFWLKTFEAASPWQVLAFVATRDANPDVRRSAVELLAEPEVLKGVRRELEIDVLVAELLDDDSGAVCRVALDLAVASGSGKALEMIRNAQEDSRLSMYATAAFARVLLASDPDGALGLYVDDHIVRFMIDDEEFLAQAHRFSAGAIVRLRECEDSNLKHLAFRIDTVRGEVKEEDARAALVLSDPGLQRDALEICFDRGWQIDEDIFAVAVKELSYPDEVHFRARFAATQNDSWLQKRANWHLAYGVVYYEARALRELATFGEQLRRDMLDGFMQFRAESAEELRARFGPSAEELISEWGGSEVDYLVAALRVVKAHPELVEPRAVSRFFDHSSLDVRVAAVEAMARIAPRIAADFATSLAMEVHASSEGSTLHRAALVALEAEPARALELSGSECASVAVLAIGRLIHDKTSIGRLRHLLVSDDEDIRIAAANRLGDLLSRGELVDVLSAYVEQEVYFYNVVVVLDRLLFGPRSSSGGTVALDCGAGKSVSAS